MLGLPTSVRISERREATRLEILAAAWEVAREKGLAALTLRDIAERVSMKAPSLYSHFDSKNALYDAMFEQAWAECLAVCGARMKRLPPSPRARIRLMATAFFDFAVEDLPRHQLMNLRIAADFTPTPQAYAPSLETMQRLRDIMAGIGIEKQADIDLYVALVGGLVESQLANDPGGDRFRRLLRRAVDMYADNVGL